MTEKRLEFLFDLGSPASYLAYTQLPGLVARTGATVAWHPILLGGVLKAASNQSPTEIPAKGRYLWEDLRRYAQRYGVDFTINPHFPINTLALMRGAVSYQHDGQPHAFETYLQACFQAIWVEAKNLNDPAVVQAVLEAAGFESADFIARTSAPETKQQLRTYTDEAVQRGVFGAPSFFVGDTMFFGQDRLDWVEAELCG